MPFTNKDILSYSTDVVIVGGGVAGLFCALLLPSDKKVTIITKKGITDSDSFLAQGGICVLRNHDDYKYFYEDTMRAGHYKNNKESVEIMINNSQNIIKDLLTYNVSFQLNNDGTFAYTKEGAHSAPRILYHEDITGKEITSKLLQQVRNRSNISIIEHTTMVDIINTENTCHGILCFNEANELIAITAHTTVWACGGVGGLFAHSTNYKHLTGDALAISLKHKIKLQDLNYVQIHPTTLYSNKPGRRYLISESVRGEGAHLLNANGERFVEELLPRDVVTKAIYNQMKIDNKPYVWLDMSPIKKEIITSHFPNIYQNCLDNGIDVTKEYVPVVPAQHYHMGGVAVNSYSKTSMNNLYAIGEASCNGVHGANRLASNSLLESLVFAKRAAQKISIDLFLTTTTLSPNIEINTIFDYENTLLANRKILSEHLNV